MSETTAPTCPRHPKTVTYLRCAACGTPICDKCAVETSVGYKCRACGTHHAGAYSPPSALGMVGVALVGLLAGALGAGVLHYIGYWGIFLAIIYGRFVGGLALKTSGRKIGLLVDILTGESIAIGGLASSLASSFLRYQLIMRSLPHNVPTPPPSWSLLALALDPYTLVFALVITGVIGAAAISRLRLPWGNWWF